MRRREEIISAVNADLIKGNQRIISKIDKLRENSMSILCSG